MGEGSLNIDDFIYKRFDHIKELFEQKQLKMKILIIYPIYFKNLLAFRISLVSSNRETLAACETSIQMSTKQITTTKKGNIKLWDQYTINAYYKFCIDYFVLPSFNFDHQFVELTGTVDAITNAELLFDLEMERITHPPSLIVKKLKITKE